MKMEAAQIAINLRIRIHDSTVLNGEGNERMEFFVHVRNDEIYNNQAGILLNWEEKKLYEKFTVDQRTIQPLNIVTEWV